jgi:biotin carboxyl carrier protein
MKYSVVVDQKTYTVEIESLSSRPIVAVVDGTRFEVWPESSDLSATTRPAESPASKSVSSARPLPVSGVPSGTAINVKSVRAPIPGVIVDIQVKQGDQVDFGQILFTIEAMKMRNAIRASRAGKIREIFVSVGQTVNHNDLLLEFAE